MRRNRIVSTAVAITFVAGVTGRGLIGPARAADISSTGQTAATPPPPKARRR